MKKILIVDDAKLMRNIIRDTIIMSVSDCEIFQASDGQEAVRLYREIRPDLVTMDVTMDIMDGVEAAKQILGYDSAAKIIMVTALGQERLLNECLEAGVKDFITKPFTSARINAVVQKALNTVQTPLNMGVC